MGVEIVDSIPKLLEKVDVVLLESVDGRIHLQEAREVFKSGKPIYIDKPGGGDARSIGAPAGPRVVTGTEQYTMDSADRKSVV